MIKNTTIIVVLIIILGLGFYLITKSPATDTEIVVDPEVVENTETTKGVDIQITEPKEVENNPETVIGTSVDGNDIVAYNFGEGDTNLLFVGGIHAGNTATLAEEVVSYLKKNPEVVPDNVKVSVIPSLNIDGTIDGSAASEVEDGRFNANGVDLNRNFACDWQEDAVWQNKAVSGGESEFSEPEAKALKSFVEKINPTAVVVWYSAAGGVYTSSCHNGVLPETVELTRLFAKESGYPANEEFDFYEITGDATNWLAKEGIPAISVLLTNHTDTEFNMNLKGVKAVLDYYAE